MSNDISPRDPDADPDKGELVGFRTCPECDELFIGYRDAVCEKCQDE